MTEPTGEVILYRRADGAPALEVRLDADTAWLSQQQIADLFQTSQQNISQHLQNVFDEGELDEAATHKDFLLVRQEGPRSVQRRVAHYNLDAIISVGYRVKSGVATQFRMWATARLREYLVKGFTMDDAKLKNLGGGAYWRELLERIRDIRSSEKVLYRQVLDLFATSAVSAYFDAAEFRAQSHEPTRMRDWVAHLEGMIAAIGGQRLDGAGTRGHAQARAKAENEYAKYRAAPDVSPSNVEQAYLERLERTQRQIEGDA